MSIDCVAAGDEVTDDGIAEGFDEINWNEILNLPLWNGREIQLMKHAIKIQSALNRIRTLADQKQFYDHQCIKTNSGRYEVMQLDDEEEELEEHFQLAPYQPADEEFSLADSTPLEFQMQECKSLLKKIWKTVKKTAKKVVHFVEDHKEEILIAAAIAAAAAGAYLLASALSASATVDNNTSSGRKKEDEEPKTDNTPPPEPIIPPPCLPEPTLPAAPTPSAPIDTTAIFQGALGAVKSGLDLIGHNITTLDTQNSPLPVHPFQGSLTQEQHSDHHVLPAIKSGIASVLEALNHPTFGLIGALAPHEHETSRFYKTEGSSIEDKDISLINGIDNTFEEALSSANYIRSLGTDLSIEGTYNHSNGKLMDLLEVFTCNYNGFSPNTGNLLISRWTNFYNRNIDRPNAKILHFCHSQGAIHTRNALMKLPKEIRNRIIVVNIAGATVIPEEMCFHAHNYVSKKDIVHYGEDLALSIALLADDEDRADFLRSFVDNKSQIIYLEPHEGATGIDHSILSPTYASTIRKHLIEYLEGEYE